MDGRSFDVWAAGHIMLYIFTKGWMESRFSGREDWITDVYPLMSECLEVRGIFSVAFKIEFTVQIHAILWSTDI